ncbi:MAG: hypothetical protein GX061_03120 [Eubacteriaceae bacterium]|nr:hypothetical protein [Eubacteriaceae bacterium]
MLSGFFIVCFNPFCRFFGYCAFVFLLFPKHITIATKAVAKAARLIATAPASPVGGLGGAAAAVRA